MQGVRELIARRAYSQLPAALDRLEANTHALQNLSSEELAELNWWRERIPLMEIVPVPEPGAVSLAVMSYNMLDPKKRSLNLGDYAQTLAALSHVLRRRNVQFVGGSPLADFLNELKDSVSPLKRIGFRAEQVRVEPIELDRDFSSGRRYPENTWLISNGWFMHRPYGGNADFPYPASVNPIFLSFHLQDESVLTPVVLRYLREHGPIGCRDWNSVRVLKAEGIEAFFSGCITSTISQLLPRHSPDTRRSRLALVEAKAPRFSRRLWRRDWRNQIDETLPSKSLVQALRDSHEFLANLAGYDHVFTSRLHTYLPARSMGIPVDFTPSNPNDIRFEGLKDISDEEFEGMRESLSTKLESTLDLVFAGATKAQVLEHWKTINAIDVAEANRRLASK